MFRAAVLVVLLAGCSSSPEESSEPPSLFPITDSQVVAEDSIAAADTAATIDDAADTAAPIEDAPVVVDARPATYTNAVLNESGDPFCGKFGDTYYLYLPDQVRRDGKVIGGRVLGFTSTDLVHWKSRGEVYSNVDETYGGKASIGLWAPEVLQRGGKYYLYFAALTANPKDERVGDKDIVVVQSSDPLNFKGGTRKVLLDNDYAFIDPSPYVDPKTDELFLLFKHRGVYGTGSEIDIRPMSDPMTFSGPATRLVTSEAIPDSEAIVEHPELHRDGSTFYLLFSTGNGARPSYRIAYATSTSPTGPFDVRGVLFKSDGTLTGDLSKKVIAPGASSIVKDGAGKTWMVYRQKTTLEETFTERAVCIDPITIGGGKITGDPTRGVPRPAPIPL